MKLGDNISFEKDGMVHTERVESVRYTSGSPAIYRRLNRWQRAVRRLTPPPWRRSLLVHPAELPTVTINQQNPVGKTLAQIEQINAEDLADQVLAIIAEPTYGERGRR